MLNVPIEARYVKIIMFNDDATPWPFVVDLLRSVFGKPEADAIAFAATVDKHGWSVLGANPSGGGKRAAGGGAGA